MTATFKRIDANKNTPTRRTLQGRIRLRLLPIFGLLLLLAATPSVLLPQIREREQLSIQRVDVSSALARDVNDLLARSVTDLSGLAGSSFVRSYNDEVLQVEDPIAPPARLRLAQRDMLRALADLVTRNPERYLAVRYLTRQNAVWGEVVNASGQVTLSTSFRLRTVDEQDEAFFALLANQISSGARLSAANFAGGYLRVYVPVPSRSGQDLGGILALDVNLLAFNGPLAQVSDSVSNLYSPERAALLVNSRGQQIASSDIDRDFDAVRQFLGQTPGVLTNVALGSLQLSTLDIAPYTGTDLPWRLVLIDDFNIQLADANALSVTLLFVVLVFGALLLTVLDRVLFASLRPLESAVSAAANRLVTSEVPRVRLAQTDTSEILLADGAGSSDAQVESLMGAIDVATQRIAGLANELDAQTRRRARDIEVASRIGRATAQLVEIDPLVNRAIQFIVAELEVYHAQVFLLDDLGINAILSYSYGEPGRKLLEAGHRLRVGSETVVGRASGSARTIVVNDTRDPQARHGFNALLPETRAELALPLIVGDQVIGVLDIQSAKAGFFIDEDLAVYELLADQLAVAINKARLLRQSDERIAQVEAFNRQMTARAWEEFEDPASNQMAYTYNLTEVKPVTQPRSGLTSQRSLNMPINVRGEVIGEISAELAPDEAMTENQRNLMRAVAERVSLAIENARLFTESRTALSETQTLYRLSRMLNEANTLEGILTAVNVVVMPNSHRALMWLFNEPVRDEALPGDAVLRADYINPSRVANPQQTVSLVGIEYDFSAFPFLHRFDFSSVAVLEDTATDLRLDPSTRALLTNIGIAAAVFVPLVIRDEWLGMALFGFAQPYAFPQVESRVFQPLINPLSIAANNRLLVERNEQFSARTAILYNASRAINSATSHADLVAAAINTTDSTEITFSLALLDGEPDEAGWPGYQRVVGYSENYAVQTLNFRHRIRVAAQSPLRQRNPEIITDATGAQADVAMRLPWLPNAHNVRFMAVYPLFSGAVPIALLYISSGVPRQISEDEDSIYRAITGQMSTQLQNRQLLEQTAEALEETRLLYIATRAITSAQTQDAVFFAAADHMARPALAAADEGTPIDLRIMIWLARPDPAANPDLLEMAYEFSNTQQPSRILDDGQRLFWTGDELPLWRALGNQSSVVLNVTDAIDPSTPQGVVANQLHANGAAAALIAAVASRDYWFGAVVVHTDRPELLTERYANFVQATAGQLALALENKLLLDQSEASANENVALYRTSRALANVNNVRDVLRVLRDTVANFDIHHIFIADLETNRWDSAGATIRVVAEWTADGQPLVMDAIMSENEMPAWPLLASPDVLMMGDRESEEAQAVLAAMGADSLALSVLDARALVVLPLRVQDRILGVAWVSSAQPITFTDRNLRVFQSFSEQASLSLDAARLLEQTNRRAQQLQTSAEVSNTASQILELDQLLPRLVDLIKARFSYDHAQIFLLDERDEFAELRASTGEAGLKLLSIRHKLKRGSASVIGQVTAQGRPIIASDTADAEIVHAPNPYLPDTRSEMALPLVIKNRVVGALDVQSNKANAFTPDDISALTTLAAQISVAIDNANLYQAAQDQANRMGLLFDITTAAAAATSLLDALQTVADKLYTELVPRDVVVYVKQLYADPLGNTFEALDPMALAGFGVNIEDVPRLRMADKGGGTLGEVARTRQLRVIGDVAIEGNYRPIVANTASVLLMPLMGPGELLGVIVMEGTTVNEFGTETVQLVQALAGSLAAIIQNAQLLDRLTSANEELMELDRLKSDFLANMSHELRTPLNSIIGFSRMMLKGMSGQLSEMQEQDLTTIFTSGNHLLTVINDILDQAKITAGKMTVSVEEFDLKPELDAVKSIGLGLVKDKPIDLRMDVSPNMPRVYGDKVRVRQVLLNLVSNASKFTRQGSVTIRAYPVSENGKIWMRVDVIDTGIGIADQDMPLLFEPFRQVDSSLTRTAGGTGLGLPIARSLMQLMGGSLNVSSVINVGSTFSITIPTEPVEIEEEPTATLEMQAVPMDSRPMVPPMPVPAPMMEMKRQILVVEDSPDMVDQYRRTLQRQGFEVIVASSMLEARAVAPALQPTLVVMDVDFDNGAGWELLEELKVRDDTNDIPVIIATLNEQRDRALGLGAFAFLQRPYSPDELVSAVEHAEKVANVPRILLIDDQDDALKMLGELLREHGNFRVYTARSGMEGLMMVAIHRPNLIVLDLRMPEMDGFAVLNELRQNPETTHIPVMVVTNEDAFRDDERQTLTHVMVVPKSSITQNEYDGFIKGVSQNLHMN